MKRKMTLFAFAGKCVPLARLSPWRRRKSAAPPMPNPACRKKWRRVISRIRFRGLKALLLGDGLVQVQEHVRSHGPRGEIGEISDIGARLPLLLAPGEPPFRGP